jgi:hypothetical protein
LLLVASSGSVNGGWYHNGSALVGREGGFDTINLAAGKVGIGTASPSAPLHVSNASNAEVRLASGSYDAYIGQDSSGVLAISQAQAGSIKLQTNGSERARLTSDGKFLVGTSSSPSASNKGVSIGGNGPNGMQIAIANTISGGFQGNVVFINANGQVGSIDTSGSSTSYVTSSDYRLKHDIQPMTGALAKLALLKPRFFKWNVDGSQSQGFIAHELQDVVPECVSGTKDAVDGTGSPKYQGVDTGFLVATLTAALQEAIAKIETLEARLTAAGIE